MLEKINQSVAFIREKTNFNPEIGVILGTGLGGLVREINIEHSLKWIKENFGTEIWISLMFQYYPAYKASNYLELNRGVTKEEYDFAVSIFQELGFYNGFIQEISCSDEYTPDFIKY